MCISLAHCGGGSGAIGCVGAVCILALVMLIGLFFFFLIGWQLADAGVL